MEKFAILVIFLGLLSSSQAISIDCFYTTVNWTFFGNMYTCEVTSLSNNDNLTDITNVTGSHLWGFNNFDVKVLFFNQNCANLPTIPRNIADIFPNFIGMHFRRCTGLPPLHGDELVIYPKLQMFGLVENLRLTQLPGHLFSNNRFMIRVIFSNNQLMEVGRGLLDPLINLRSASFANNICINQTAESRLDIPALIETLRTDCPDHTEIPTTTWIPGTTNQYGCIDGNLNDRICQLEVENQQLRSIVDQLARDVANVQEKLLEISTQPCTC